METADEAFNQGYALGEWLRHDRDNNPESCYDPRWDFADAAKTPFFNEYKQGFDEAFG